ncbi:hypothetical protein ACVT81_001666 [Yersinia enterocolitica]|uniref:hypothetical protein n=1 Tax=Yersinia intermedia TaxID=631 RepID=UPI0039C729C5
MPLKCPQCGSRNTLTNSAGELSGMTGDKRFLTAAAGYINPGTFPELIKEIARVLGKLFGYLEQREKNIAPVLVCKDCGHWKRI